MSQIVTLTLNPSLDKSSSTPFIKPEAKLRCNPPRYEPGGGGINVSRAIKKLGGDSLAIFLNGGFTGGYYEELIKNEGLSYLQIPTKSATRENFIVVNESTGEQLRFGMPGPDIQEKEWKSVLHTISNLAQKPEYLVASGSLCPGIPEDFYAILGETCQVLGIRYVVDTSGIPLEHALHQGVFLLKPNLSELAALSGAETLEESNITDAAREIIGQGKCEIMVVSLGAAGAMLVSKDQAQKIQAPVVQRKSTVGAGDSMVAGMVWSLLRHMPMKEVVQYGVACGSAATMNEGTELCKKVDVDRLFNAIREKE